MFCSNCGKEIRQGANFCMYCGTPVGDIENENIQNAIYEDITYEDITYVEYMDMTEEDNEYSTYENEKLSFQKILKKYDNAYSNCENGKVSFLKMLKKFFSKEIKEYFSFDGTYSRLEYFYFNLIINVVFFIFDPWFQQYFPFMLLPSVIVHLWLHISSAVKRLKDLGFSSLGILIPIICIFVGRTNKDNPALIVPSILILIFYQIYTIFVPGEKFKGLNEECADYEENDETEESEEDIEKGKVEKLTIIDFFLIFIFGLMISAIIAILAKG